MTKHFSKVVIMGLGYIGLPTAALVAKNKLEVLGVDVNSGVVDTIKKGQVHIIEPDLEGLVKTVVEKGYLQASTKPSKADVFIITVPTPFKNNHDPDISYVEDATKAIIPFLKSGDLFIIESTCPVGTTEKMAELIYYQRPDIKNKLFIAYCPERVLPGNIIYELKNNDRVIGGINEQSTKKAIDFYITFVKAELHKTDARTAEMCKLTENSSRDVNIAFANELSVICDRAGINVWELIDLANKHPRINILQPGTGVGGHCIAVDPWFIISDFKEQAKLIRTARDINNFKTQWVIEKIKNQILEYEIEHKKEPEVAFMGITFKPDIDDIRESPALIVTKHLLNFKKAGYFVVEPNLNHIQELTLLNYEDAYKKADIVVFLVAHKEFKTLEVDKKKIELDFCGVRNRGS